MYRINQKVRVILDKDFEVFGTIVGDYEETVELNLYEGYNWEIPKGIFPIVPYEDYYNSDEYTRENY